MPLPPQTEYLCQGVTMVSSSSLPGQSYRASGNLGIGGPEPAGNGYTVTLYNSDLSTNGGNFGTMEDVPAGKDPSLWPSVSNNTTELWTEYMRGMYAGPASDGDCWLELWANYNSGQVSTWPQGNKDPNAPTDISNLICAQLSFNAPMSGQDHRSSLNFSTLYSPNGSGDIRFEIRVANVGVDPWACPIDNSTTVQIMEDVHAGIDPTIWTGIRSGSTVSYASYGNLYVANPSNSSQNFYILLWREN